MGAHITSIYAALCGILMIALALRVTLARRRYRVGVGSGGEESLERAIRVHANFAEFVPLALILMLLAELGGVTGWLMHVFGITLVVSRLLHAWGLTRSGGESFGRMYGTLGTWALILVLAVLILLRQA
ncbi:MAG TPA: MAPEG family protein [Gammaproteobacteria bacterium]|nr:MAPEG family protein [Gammaproteobacteria bacterium]